MTEDLLPYLLNGGEREVRRARVDWFLHKSEVGRSLNFQFSARLLTIDGVRLEYELQRRP